MGQPHNASMYTLGQAAKAVGRSKSTVSRAIEQGRLEAAKDDHGRYQIDPQALRQLFRETPVGTALNSDDIAALQTRLAVAERLAEERLDTINDLRARLDEERAERQTLLGLQLADDEQKPSAGNFFQRRFSR